jgi:hypothetical protein
MRTLIALFLLGTAVFAGFAGPRLKIHSADNHFVYLADAFLNGQLELTRPPHHKNDWASYDEVPLKGTSAEAHGDVVRGFFTRRAKKPNEFRLLSGEEIELPRKDRGKSTRHHYVSFPPMPAVLMMPMVALSGYGANDVIFTVVFGGLNLMLVFLLLQGLRNRGLSERTRRENLWFSVLFGFGSAHLWCAVLGQVWFTALIVGVTFHLLYVHLAVDARRPLLAGLALAAAFSTRATLVFAAPFFYLQLLYPASGVPLERKEQIRRAALFTLPCLVVGVALMAYNHARFESVTEFGHRYLATGTLPRIRDFGLFGPEFLNRNLTAALTLMPKLSSQAPYIQFTKHGMGILISTPALAYVLWPRQSARLARPAAVTAAIIAVPILFYQNTGWEQFSYRFALDFMPYLLVLLAVGGRPVTKTMRALIVYGVLMNAFGAITFKRGGKLYGHHMTEEPRR